MPAARPARTARLHRRRDDPPILDQVFSGKHNLLKGGVIDDEPLSETRGDPPVHRPTARNYIQWLIDAARHVARRAVRAGGLRRRQAAGARCSISSCATRCSSATTTSASGCTRAPACYDASRRRCARAATIRSCTCATTRWSARAATSRSTPSAARSPAARTLTVHELHRAPSSRRWPSPVVPARQQLAALERLEGRTDGAARAGVRRSRRLLRLPARRLAARHRQRTSSR